MTKSRSIVSLSFCSILMFAATVGYCQHVPIEQEANQSLCSNIVAITGNNQINCSGLTPEQAKELNDISVLLKELLSHQANKKVLESKLDEIYTAVSKTPQLTDNTVVNQGPCSNSLVNPPAGTPINQTVHCGDMPMKMSDAGLAGYENALKTTPIYEGLVILLTTYSQDSFELSERLCTPWRELVPTGTNSTFSPPYVCPQTSGPSVRDRELGHLEIWGGFIPGIACVLPNGMGLGYSHIGGCSGGLVIGGTPPHPEGEDLERSSFTGLTCYSDDWSNPRSVAFKAAISAAGLSCEYVPHAFHLSGMGFFEADPGEGFAPRVEKITVVIGKTVEP